MESSWVCRLHGTPSRTVPAGVSKRTNKPYGAFEVCSTPNCNEKPPKVQLEASEPIDNAILKQEAQTAIRNDQDRSRRIERQHSQSVAVEFWKLLGDLTPAGTFAMDEDDLWKKIMEYTDKFQADLEPKP